MKNLLAGLIFILASLASDATLAGERGILVLRDGEKVALDQLRFKAEPFKRDWTRDCSLVDCKNVIRDRAKPKPPVWCSPTVCDPVNPDAINALIGDKTPHMRVRPDGQASLFIGNSQMTEPQRIAPPRLADTKTDLSRLPVLPVVIDAASSSQILYWLRVPGK